MDCGMVSLRAEISFVLSKTTNSSAFVSGVKWYGIRWNTLDISFRNPNVINFEHGIFLEKRVMKRMIWEPSTNCKTDGYGKTVFVKKLRRMRRNVVSVKQRNDPHNSLDQTLYLKWHQMLLVWLRRNRIQVMMIRGREGLFVRYPKLPPRQTGTFTQLNFRISFYTKIKQ